MTDLGFLEGKGTPQQALFLIQLVMRLVILDLEEQKESVDL